jgi:AcrR family transcriptional regulator
MTSVADNRSSATSRRRRDAARSRRALLAAAAALFDERGYESATIRDIGERAGVDPALIARYFGGKEGLYLATVNEEPPIAMPPDPVGALAAILGVAERRGIGPVPLAMVTPTLSDAIRAETMALVRARVLEPLASRLAAHGVEDPELRAELLVAATLGISLTRAAGTLPRLADTSLDRLLKLLEPVAAGADAT